MQSTERSRGAGRGCGSAPACPPRSRRAGLWIAALLGLVLGFGCASRPPQRWEFFTPASPELDAWYSKVSEWQIRARAERIEPLPASPAEDPLRRDQRAKPAREAGLDPLPEKLAEFAGAERRILAERIFDWTRRTAIYYYKSDHPEERESRVGPYVPEDPADDHWPTYSELVAENGDDCDGLDLIAYRMLYEFGFPRDQIFRAVVRNDISAANHMLTFWFEDPSDPWVFDATGAITMEFKRFSEISGFTPTAIFNETEQYVARQRPAQPGRSARVHGASHD